MLLIFGAPQGERTTLVEPGASTRTIFAHDDAKSSCARRRPDEPPYKILLTVNDRSSNSSFEFEYENQNPQPLTVGSAIKLQNTTTFWNILGNKWRATILNLKITEIGSNYVLASAKAYDETKGVRTNNVGAVFPGGGSAAGRAEIVSAKMKITCN